MKYLKESWFKLVVLILLFMVLFWLFLNKSTSYSTELSKQDLAIKCEELYAVKHTSLENARYNGNKNDALIWSPKTKSCLAYYNVPQKYGDFLFEVWDYTNTDLVLSYKSYRTEKCVMDGLVISQQSLMYKLNTKLENQGCDLILMKDGIDILTNFEIAMLDLGFKK